MKPQQAYQNLVNVIAQGRIVLNGSPLTLQELQALGQSAKLLYDIAMEFEESKKAKKEDKPAEDKSC